MLDETFGFTIVAAERMPPVPPRVGAERTLFVTGICCYAAWIMGTVLGILGAGVQGLNGVAEALFPVLFVGLAALTARTLSLATRALWRRRSPRYLRLPPDWRAWPRSRRPPGRVARRSASHVAARGMTLLTVLALAAITYGSRLSAMVLLPRPSGRVEAVLSRVPAAIFASLATLSLITPDRQLVDTPILIATAAAVLVAPRRSFALCLAAGIAGYGLAMLIGI